MNTNNEESKSVNTKIDNKKIPLEIKTFNYKSAFLDQGIAFNINHNNPQIENKNNNIKDLCYKICKLKINKKELEVVTLTMF